MKRYDYSLKSYKFSREEEQAKTDILRLSKSGYRIVEFTCSNTGDVLILFEKELKRSWIPRIFKS